MDGTLARSTMILKQAIGDLYPDPKPIVPPTITIKKSRETPNYPQKPESKPLGKITSFNYQGDPYSDSLSKKGIGSFGPITGEGIAVSPDVEQVFREAGIKPKDKLIFGLKDGSETNGIWQDRTMQDKQAIKKYGKPFRGRIDFNMAQGKNRHSKDGMEVISFRKAE